MTNVNGDQTGPVFTTSDIKKIRDYVDYGSGLPVVMPAVIVFIGYKHAGIPGLEPKDMQELFVKISNHAAQWDGIQDDIKQKTKHLSSTSKKIVSGGNGLIKMIRNMPFYEKVTATVGQNPLTLPPDKIPDEPLGKADSAGKSNLEKQLETLIGINSKKSLDTQATMKAVTSFRKEISVLEPEVANKRKAVKNSNLEKIGSETTVEPMIEALTQEYQRTLSSHGDPAVVAAKREALDNALATLRDQLEVYRGRQRVTYTMGRLFVHLTELGVSMVNTEMSLGHLWTIWEKAASDLEESSKTLSGIGSTRSLIVFTGTFQSVIDHWTRVSALAAELGRIF